MKVERYHRPEDPADADMSRYRITPTDGSTWEVDIISVDGRFIWRVPAEALEVESSETFSSEEYALNAAVRYILDVEAASQEPD